jgi:hypothetical protein
VPEIVAEAIVSGADGRSELYVIEPVAVGVAPEPAFIKPSGVDFKKMLALEGTLLDFG